MKLFEMIKGAWKALKDKLDSLIMLVHCNLIIWCDKYTGEIVSQEGEVFIKPTWRNTVLKTIELFFYNKPLITLSGIALLSLPFAWASATIAGSSIIMETLIVSSLFLMAYLVYLSMKAWDETLNQHLAYNNACRDVVEFIPADCEAEKVETGDNVSETPEVVEPLSTKPVIDFLVKAIKADNATKKKGTDKFSPEEVFLIANYKGKPLFENPELMLVMQRHPKFVQLNAKLLNSKQFKPEYLEDEFCQRLQAEIFTAESTSEKATYTESFKALLKAK